jgi:hypothetical protein
MIEPCTADLITRADVQDWPTATDPMTKQRFTPAFIYRNHAGQLWVVSTVTDGNGKHEDEPGFNPARWPQWVAIAGQTKTDAATSASEESAMGKGIT